MQNLVSDYLNRANAFSNDFILFKVAASLPEDLLASFEEVGKFVSSKEAQDLARLANKNPPSLYRNKEFGSEFQSIELHPSYHALLRRSKHIGLISSLWENIVNEQGVRYQARAIRLFLMGGLENGHLDEIIQTNAGIAALINENELYNMLNPYLLSRQHDASDREIIKKRAITFSIVHNDPLQKNYNYAKKLSTNTDLLINNYSITASQCLVSNPGADGFFLLAELGGGLSCFFVPKFDMHGKLNNIKVNYLVDSAGYCSRPLAKVSFENSIGWMIGQVGEGYKVSDSIDIIRQFDQTLVAVSTMRTALSYVIDCLRYNSDINGDGKGISPITKRIFADMALDIVAIQSFAFKLAKAFDNSVHDKEEAAFARVMTPVAAYWANSLVVPIIGELISHLGIEHYRETSVLFRALRDAPVRLLNSKSVNAMVEDVISITSRAPGLVQKIYEHITSDSLVGTKTIEVLNAAAQLSRSNESAGRFLVEQMAYSASCAALHEFDNNLLFTAFAETRLGGQWRSTYGNLNMRYNPDRILELLYPNI